MTARVAALYVDPKGVYAGLPDVEVWDEARDARGYFGPYPVVAHPPCAAWSAYRYVRQACFGLPAHEDGGCFNHALWAVRALGGVLEHPARSAAWAWYGLPAPTVFGGWQQTIDGEWVASLDQASFGHRLRKPTWLFYVGAQEPPPLRFAVPTPGRTVDGVWSRDRTPTPPAFRDYLVSMAVAAA